MSQRYPRRILVRLAGWSIFCESNSCLNRVVAAGSQSSNEEAVVRQLWYGFDFADRFNEVKLRDYILHELFNKPIGIIVKSFDGVLCYSPGSSLLVCLGVDMVLIPV